MLEIYLSVIYALLTLTDMHGYHAQLLTVTSDIDMISVVFIRGKSLKLCTSMSIHTTGISLDSATRPRKSSRSSSTDRVLW